LTRIAFKEFIQRSKSVDGIAEALVKSKKYVAVPAVLSPEFAAGL
jgi:hypothetical protein